ncbi:MAG: hypothetical protein U0V48_13125 [Anaerolineales bacterium]
MKPNDIFSVRDFFNYYIAGLFWGLDILLLVFFGATDLQDKLTALNSFANQFSPVIQTLTLIFIPYLLGFILNPFSTKLAEKIRNRYNEAIEWVTDPKHKYAGQGLKEWEKETIKEKMKDLYNLQDKRFSEIFFTIRAYVEENSKGANGLATRALDLTNFSESLLLPLPLSFMVTGFLYIFILKSWWAILFFILGSIVFSMCLNRYLALRSYWVKHVYRAFIAVTAKERLDRAKK